MDTDIINIVKGDRVRQCKACDFDYFFAQGFSLLVAVEKPAEAAVEKPKRGRPRKANVAECGADYAQQ
jgi:uncharacterized protein YneR